MKWTIGTSANVTICMACLMTALETTAESGLRALTFAVCGVGLAILSWSKR